MRRSWPQTRQFREREQVQGLANTADESRRYRPSLEDFRRLAFSEE